jgi:hypothetical protein
MARVKLPLFPGSCDALSSTLAGERPEPGNWPGLFFATGGANVATPTYRESAFGKARGDVMIDASNINAVSIQETTSIAGKPAVGTTRNRAGRNAMNRGIEL